MNFKNPILKNLNEIMFVIMLFFFPGIFLFSISDAIKTGFWFPANLFGIVSFIEIVLVVLYFYFEKKNKN